MSGTLGGKVALVTGASRGIGRAIALKLGSEGALVAVHFATSRQAAEAVVADISAAGGTAFAVQADLSRMADIDTLFDALDVELARHGAGALDILVNNAGIGVGGGIESLTEADFDRVFTLNVKGMTFVTQRALSRIPDGGRIVNISSMVGHNAYPGLLAYAATKAAVDSLTLSMAAGLGKRRITVNSVAPGATESDFMGGATRREDVASQMRALTALQEIGKPDDIAEVVAFLASDAGRWITGERIRASGGMHL